MFLTGLFIVILAGIAAGTIAEIAKAIARRGTSSSELTALKQQVERYAASLDDAHASLADQAAQLAELQERVDFAERLLAQGTGGGIKARVSQRPGRHSPDAT